MEKVIFTQGYSGDPVRAMLWLGEEPNMEARFAMNLLEKFALIAGTPGEEDSQGRATIALLPVEEAVQRACDLSQQMYAELRKRNLMLPMPSYEEAVEQAREARGKN